MEEYCQEARNFIAKADEILKAAVRYSLDISAMDKRRVLYNYKDFPIIEAFPEKPAEIIGIAADNLSATLRHTERVFAEFLKYSSFVGDAKRFLEDYYNYTILVRMASQTRLQSISLYRKTALETLPSREVNGVRQKLIEDAAKILAPLIKTAAAKSILTAFLIEKKTPFCLAIYVVFREEFLPEQRAQVSAVVESRISEILPERPVPDFLARRYTPMTKSMPWKDLMEKYYRGDYPDSEDSKTDGQGIVIIEYSTPTAIDFDISCLVSPPKELEIIGNAGVSQRTILRYATAEVLSGSPRGYSARLIRGAAPYMVVESISQGLYRLLSLSGDIPKTSSRPQEYFNLHGVNIFKPTHNNILARLVERVPISNSSSYDLLLRDLVEKFHSKKLPKNLEEYLGAIGFNDVSSAIYAQFPHTHLLNLKRESMVSYLLRLEPTIRELIYPEIYRCLVKFAPGPEVFTDLGESALRNKLDALYEQSVSMAMETAKAASWLEDADQTYKICYLYHD